LTWVINLFEFKNSKFKHVFRHNFLLSGHSFGTCSQRKLFFEREVGHLRQILPFVNDGVRKKNEAYIRQGNLCFTFNLFKLV